MIIIYNLESSINLTESLNNSSKSVKHKYNTRYQARLERQKSNLSDDTSIGENSNKNKSNLCHNNNETNYLNKNSINIDNIDDIVVDEEEETENN